MKKYAPVFFRTLSLLTFLCFLFFLLVNFGSAMWLKDVPGIDFLLMAVIIYPAGFLHMLGFGEHFASPTIVFPLLNLAGAVVLYLPPTVLFYAIAWRLTSQAAYEQLKAKALGLRSHEILSSILLILGIPRCYDFLAIKGMAFIGAGHGSDYFGSLPLSPCFGGVFPLFVSRLFWLVFAFLLAFRRVEFCRKAAWFLLFLHYAGVVWLSFTTEWSYVFRVVDSEFVSAAVHLAIYLGSQILFCFLLKRAALNPNQKVIVL